MKFTRLKKKRSAKKASRNLVGPAVKELRLAQRPAVSQEDLAGRLAARGVSIDRSAIARIERGDRYVLDYEVLCIAKAFRVPIDRLFPKRKN